MIQAQEKYYAHWLTRSLPSDNIGKFTASLQDAQVDLTPHQIDAALFAFKSPLSKGAILADEVGLGKTIEAGNLNPFNCEEIVICSYQFARAKAPYLKQTPWDLAVIDEAHRLRNVYKSSSKIANTIKNALADRKKILLTATPLQNSILELYGLTSLIDDYEA